MKARIIRPIDKQKERYNRLYSDYISYSEYEYKKYKSVKKLDKKLK